MHKQVITIKNISLSAQECLMSISSLTLASEKLYNTTEIPRKVGDLTFSVKLKGILHLEKSKF